LLPVIIVISMGAELPAQQLQTPPMPKPRWPSFTLPNISKTILLCWLDHWVYEDGHIVGSGEGRLWNDGSRVKSKNFMRVITVSVTLDFSVALGFPRHWLRELLS
jgi:hypothetical protein